MFDIQVFMQALLNDAFLSSLESFQKYMQDKTTPVADQKIEELIERQETLFDEEYHPTVFSEPNCNISNTDIESFDFDAQRG